MSCKYFWHEFLLNKSRDFDVLYGNGRVLLSTKPYLILRLIRSISFKIFEKNRFQHFFHQRYLSNELTG